MLYGTKFIADQKFYIPEIEIFDLFCSCDIDLDWITFIYEINLYSPDIYTRSSNTNFLRQGFRKLSSDRQTDRQTD